MTARTVEEWIGKTPDTKPPARVLVRIFEKHEGRDYITGQKIASGMKWQADHIVALVNGGENRESNLAPLLVTTHKAKTAQDMAIKAKIAAVKKRDLGLTSSSRKIKSAGFPPRQKQKNAASSPVNKWNGWS